MSRLSEQTEAPVERRSVTHSLSAAFDAVAPTYNRLYSAQANALMGWLRRENLALMQATFPPGSRLLEIGCGTGEEAVALAQAGYRIWATDISPGMVARTVQRARAHGLERQVHAIVLAAGDLACLSGEGRFEGAYSSFGALNCEPDLSVLAGALSRLLQPGAAFICSVMARCCPFETVWFALHGRFREAVRRHRRGWQKVPLHLGNGRNVPVPTRYLTLGDLKRAFSPYFRVVRVLAFPLLLPPPYLEGVYRRQPRLWRHMERLERRIREWPLWRRCGDHIWVEMRNVRGTRVSLMSSTRF